SGACGAVLLWTGLRQAQSERSADYASLRRLQMAAEAGRAMAVCFRSTQAEALSTPAHLRIVAFREEGVLKIRIPKRRGPPLVTPVPISALAYRVRKVESARVPLHAVPSPRSFAFTVS